MAKTFYIKSMGCKSNQFEGALIIENMENHGYKQVMKPDEAELYILNSCSVTHKSDNEALYTLRNIKHLYPNTKTVLTGCLAQIEKEKLLELGYIDYIFGNDDKLNIGELLQKETTIQVSDIMGVEKFNPKPLYDTTKTRLSLKVQDGCNNRCAYCIIPFARGRSRSAEPDFIINQIEHAVEIGFKEVVITGIHIGQWGLDFGKNFVDLIKILESTQIHRYRLGSLNPLEITDDLVKVLKDSEKFCPHFHLSLQSACNKTLKSMNRLYSVEKYLDQIEMLAASFDRPFLGSDIIAGFVGESEADFKTTVENLKKSRLTKIHTFPYSVRKGTQGEMMEGHLPDSVKQERADIIKRISSEKFDLFMDSNTDTTQEVLIEKRPDKHTGKLKGVTGNYINVLIDGDIGDYEGMFNTLQKVRLTTRDFDKFYGVIE